MWWSISTFDICLTLQMWGKVLRWQNLRKKKAKLEASLGCYSSSIFFFLFHILLGLEFHHLKVF